MTVQETIAGSIFYVFLALTVLRFHRARTNPLTRYIWLALMVGMGGMFAAGGVLPLQVVDGWLGGTNIANLVQNACATTAFWLVWQAARVLAGCRFSARAAWALVWTISAFATALLLDPSRGATSHHFIHEHAQDWFIIVYASVYMLSVAWFSGETFWLLRGHSGFALRVIRVGTVAVAAGSVFDVIYLTSRGIGMPNEALWLVDRLFIPLFFGGVGVLALGIAWFAAARAVRDGLMAQLRNLLTRTVATRDLDPMLFDSDAPTVAVFLFAVQLADLGNEVDLSRWERLVLRVVTFVLDRRTKAPRMQDLSLRPSTVSG